VQIGDFIVAAQKTDPVAVPDYQHFRDLMSELQQGASSTAAAAAAAVKGTGRRKLQTSAPPTAAKSQSSSRRRQQRTVVNDIEEDDEEEDGVAVGGDAAGPFQSGRGQRCGSRTQAPSHQKKQEGAYEEEEEDETGRGSRRRRRSARAARSTTETQRHPAVTVIDDSEEEEEEEERRVSTRRCVRGAVIADSARGTRTFDSDRRTSKFARKGDGQDVAAVAATYDLTNDCSSGEDEAGQLGKYGGAFVEEDELCGPFSASLMKTARDGDWHGRGDASSLNERGDLALEAEVVSQSSGAVEESTFSCAVS
jgi:hypothetical protein